MGRFSSSESRHLGSRRHARLSDSSRRLRRNLTIGIGALLIVGFGAALILHVVAVKRDLEVAQSSIGTIKAQAAAQDVAGMSSTINAVTDSLSDASAQTSTLTWRVAELIPMVGPNLSAVRVLSTQTAQVLKGVAQPLFAALPEGGKLPKNADGTLDISFISNLGPVVDAAPALFSTAQKDLDSVNSPFLLPVIADALHKGQELVTSAIPITQQAPEYFAITKMLLGIDHPTTIGLVALNNAEVAALGGQSEQVIILQAKKGDIQVSGQYGMNDFRVADAGVNVPRETTDIVGSGLLNISNLASSRPDFPTAAQILRGHLSRDFGITPPVFIGLDNTALAKILAATGPISLSTGDVLTSENAATLLLNEVYFRYNNPSSNVVNMATNKFFQSAAQGILGTIKSGKVDPLKLLPAIGTAVESGGLMVWFEDPALQKFVAGTHAGGQLAPSNTAATEVGVYFQDASTSKIDYYLKTDVKLSAASCNSTGDIVADVTLKSLLTQEKAKSLPTYVGSANFGADFFETRVFVYAPWGATFKSIEVTEKSSNSVLEKTGKDLGRNVARLLVDLKPGEQAVLRVIMTGATSPAGPLSLRATPMINGTNSTSQPRC